MSVSTLGPGRKENQGDFHAEGDSKLLFKGVSLNLQTKNKKYNTTIYKRRKYPPNIVCLHIQVFTPSIIC